MNARFDLRMTKDEFLRWAAAPERRKIRCEWARGRVIQMINVTRWHSTIVINFILALGPRLDRTAWQIHGLEFGVEDEDYLRYPDILIEPAGGPGNERRSARPAIIIEVLSASTSKTDFVDKLAEYTSIPSLEAYIIASQEEVVCWLWERGEDGTFPARPVEIGGLDQSLALRARGISLPLAELYRGTQAV